MSLDSQTKEKIYTRVCQIVTRKHFDPGMNGANWEELSKARRGEILAGSRDRAGGAHAIAVATGNYTRADLEAHHPDSVLDDLQDTEAVVDALLRYSKSEQRAPIV